jgi:hypothetical protein
MASVSIQDNTLVVDIQGADKLLALRSHIDIPMANIAGIRHDPEETRRWWAGLRAPGTALPGLIEIGTFYQDGRRIFFDVHDPAKTVIVDLRDDRFDELVLEVDDPDAVIAKVEKSLADGRTSRVG